MSARGKKIPPALKHGGYSATALLPGEDPGVFKKLHDALIAELSPEGALEEDTVASIARLVWRKHHPATFQVEGPIPRIDRYEAIRRSTTAQEAMENYIQLIKEDSITSKQMSLMSGEFAAKEQFMNVLAIEERLDTMIDRCLKRLLFLRGLKSLTPAKFVSSPALKHGGYCAKALLPGEDPAAFKKLHDGLIAELSQAGALEEDIVASIARLVWRKPQLARFQVVGPKQHKSISAIIAVGDLRTVDSEDAMKRYEALIYKKPDVFERKTEDRKISRSDTHQNKPQEQNFVRSSEIATIEQFMNALAVEERLDAMIDRCLKRLLFLRGLKSLAPAKSSSQPPAQKRLRSVQQSGRSL
jgi:hypothetical protein